MQMEKSCWPMKMRQGGSMPGSQRNSTVNSHATDVVHQESGYGGDRL